MNASTLFSLFYPPYFHSTHCKRYEVLDLDTQSSLKQAVGREINLIMSGFDFVPLSNLRIRSSRHDF